ncbi:MAG TPA: hypothetical protein VE641_05865, partial [Chthoniobacterales bacterium]|nr:hypothetical protein [Chthoniobacterales bacterium]
MSIEREAYEITEHDVVNDTVTTRLIQPLAQPTQRFVKPALPELTELRQQIDELTNEINETVEAYDQISLDEFYS